MSAGKNMMLAAAGAGGGIPWELDKFALTNENRLPVGIGTSTLYPQYKWARAHAWKDDGTRLYVAHYWTSGVTYIYQYNASTAFDMTSLSLSDNGSVQVNAYESYPSGLFFKPDGTAFFLLGTQNDKIHKYTMSTAWDVSTASYTHSSDALANASYTVIFKPDGTKFFYADYTNDRIVEHTLSTAWDVTSSSSTQTDTATLSTYALNSNFRGIMFNPTGTQIYIHNGSYWAWTTLSTAWDLTTLQGWTTGNNGSTKYGYSFWGTSNFNSNGTEMFTANANGTIDKWQLSTAYDLSTMSLDCSAPGYKDLEGFAPSSISTYGGGFWIKPDGTKVFICIKEDYTSYIQAFNMSTPFDASTITIDTGNKFTSNTFSDCNDITMSSDGTKLYSGRTYQGQQHTITMTSAWDLSTGTISGPDAYIQINYGGYRGAYWHPNGTAIFYSNGSTVQKRNVTTAWDISTASFTADQSLSLSSKFPTVPYVEGLEFGDSGYRMYLLYTRSGLSANNSQSTAWIAELSLSTAYDLTSTVTKISEIPFHEISPILQGMRWDPTGQKLMVLSERKPIAIATCTSG